MPSEILAKPKTIVKPAITAGALANGAGRLCDLIDNSVTQAAMAFVWLTFQTGGSAPTLNTPVKLYLVRHSEDGTTDLADDGLGDADAAVATEPSQAECLGSIRVTVATSAWYTKCFLAYDLPPGYSFVVWNAIGQALTTATVALQVLPIVPEGQ